MNNFAQDFPLLKKHLPNHTLVYFDSAATTPKPTPVIQAITQYYESETGNPGRGNHFLSFNAAKKVEESRHAVLSFFDAEEAYNAAFTKNATEAINMVAYSFAQKFKTRKTKPVIITTEAEHHANFLPWQRLHKEDGFPLHIVPVLSTGEIDVQDLTEAIKKHTNGLLAITHASNVTGIVTKLVPILDLAQKQGFEVLVDATQSAPHFPISLRKLPVTYLAVSAHKMYGPEGVGFLLVRNDALETFNPMLLGGGIVKDVSPRNSVFTEGIHKLEAGTPNTAGIIATKAAIDYLTEARSKGAFEYEEYLHDYFIHAFKEKRLENILPLISLTSAKLPIFTFHSSIHPHDIADYLDEHGIAVRAGHHCAQLIHKRLHVPASVRISLSFYNSKEEIDYFLEVLSACTQVFQ